MINPHQDTVEKYVEEFDNRYEEGQHEKSMTDIVFAFEAGEKKGRKENREMIIETLKTWPLPSIGQDGGAWRDAFQGFLILIIRELEEARKSD